MAMTTTMTTSDEEEEEAEEEEEEEEEDEEENETEFLEICVETLLGTVFELRLSPLETLASIKARLMRLEGIPVQQMNLLLRGKELSDHMTLSECGIVSGDTLQLVLTLRGGPINTRRILLPQSSSLPPPQETNNYHNSKNKLLEKLSKNGQLTVVMFREGNQVNLYRVLDNGSNLSTNSGEGGGGGGAGYSDSWSSNSIKNLLTGSLKDQNRKKSLDPNNPEMQKRLQENALTMSKMNNLRAQLENLSLSKKSKSKKKVSNTTKLRTHSGKKGKRTMGTKNSKPVLPPIYSKQHRDSIGSLNEEEEEICTITPLNKPNSSMESPGSSGYNIPEWLLKSSPSVSTSSSWSRRISSSSSSRDIDLIDLHQVGDEVEIVNRRKTQPLITADISSLTTNFTNNNNNRLSYVKEYLPLVPPSKRSRDLMRTQIDLEEDRLIKTSSSTASASSTRSMSSSSSPKKRLQQQQQQQQYHQKRKKKTKKQPSFVAVKSGNESSRAGSSSSVKIKKSKKKKPRCNEATCKKKLNITNTYSCRCGLVFCMKHRHPESHQCQFDYKKEGRKILESTNPIVTFPKLPKI